MKRATGLMVLPMVVVCLAATGVAMGASRAPGAELSITAATATAPVAPQSKGRYKKEGNACVWNASDSGPNQCTPVTAGRFKKSGDACVWDAGDRGADQCTPSKGRFKKEGDRCEWNATDSGPNQCDPRQPK